MTKTKSNTGLIISIAEVTLKQALTATNIFQLKKEYPRDIARITTQLLTEGLEGIGHEMSSKAIALWATDFIEIYYTDSLEDLAMMLKLARTSQLSKCYGKADSAQLFAWYIEYLDIKLDEKEKQIVKKKEEIIDKADLKKIHETYKKLKKKKRDNRPDHIKTLEAKIEQARKYQDLFTPKQFKEIAKECRRWKYEKDAKYFEELTK